MTADHLPIAGTVMGEALGVSTEPSWASFFSQHVYGRPRIPERSWLDKWSWVAMLAMRFWVSGKSSPVADADHARLLLAEELRHGVRMPARVVLEVKGEAAAGDVQGCCIFFDAGGSYPSLLALLMAYPQSLFPVPLRWIPTLDEDLRLSPNEQRARAAGIVHDPPMSARMARALVRTYGPFSSEWFAAARGCRTPW